MRSLDGYPSLLAQVKKTLIEGQQKIEAERVRLYWETGRMIHAHILKHEDRAEYGGEVINQLAGDLNIGARMLHYCVQFARAYPRSPIVNTCSQFTWSHFRRLIGVSDLNKRRQLEKTIGKNALSARELGLRIKEDRGQQPAIKTRVAVPSFSNKPLTPLRGELYTYTLVKRPVLGSEESALMVDLGFGIFHHVDARSVARFKEGDIIGSTRQSRTAPSERKSSEGSSYKFEKGNFTAKDLYTYQATIEKVIDGDTLKVRMDLGFGTEVRHTLRLRGIDCPEMSTKEGQEAKVFVQAHLKEAQRVIVRSSRSDKYDRYLADVYIPQEGQEKELFLNNLLLEKNYAKRMD